VAAQDNKGKEEIFIMWQHRIIRGRKKYLLYTVY
jgi:hypothetical protein